MKHTLKIRHLGPIENCTIEINRFNILTGPQSNGKSTIAKAIFFFRTVKQDILKIMMQGGPQAVTEMDDESWERILNRKLKEKFMQLFGTSWVMPQDMCMEYTYAKGVSISICLDEDILHWEKNYINITYSKKLATFLDDLNNRIFTNMTVSEKEHHAKELDTIFCDEYETVFIPAGRNLITLLSTQLNYIFTSLEGPQLRGIDYVTKQYTELILKLKPMFDKGMEGIWAFEKGAKKRSQETVSSINQLIKETNRVLCGKYKYVDGDERLYLDDKRYVKINLSSSGQQEIVWVFNLLFYYLLENKRVFLILEEPESHLYPESQRIVGEILALFSNCKNSALITTHSPYLLGTFNYLLMAHQVPSGKQETIKKTTHKTRWLDPKLTSAIFIQDGKVHDAISSEDGLTLIQNDKIDGASQIINERTDLILEQFWEVGDNGEITES